MIKILIIIGIIFFVWLFMKIINIPPIGDNEDFYDIKDSEEENQSLRDNLSITEDEKILENVLKFFKNKDEIEFRQNLDDIKVNKK